MLPRDHLLLMYQRSFVCVWGQDLGGIQHDGTQGEKRKGKNSSAL